MDEALPLVELTGVTVRFGATTAIDKVDFRMFAGEVHSLMGENGAGKSTLIKSLTGALAPDEGVIAIGGVKQAFDTPLDAQEAGIRTVYQEIDLLPNLSVAENIVLGREPRRFGMIDQRAMRAQAAAVLDELGLDLDVAAPLGIYSVAVQQLVAIARAISTELKVLVLDEPTSSLDTDEVAELFRVIRELKERGVAVLFVSHFLDQVYEICDRITVLRDGALVGEYRTTELLRIDLVQKMLGREASFFKARERVEQVLDPDGAFLTARDLTVGTGIMGANLDVAEGEVLGLAGLLGSGRTELARALTGIDRAGRGEIAIEGERVDLATPRRALSRGIVYSSENRQAEGLMGDMSIAENIALALQAQRGALKPLSAHAVRELATSWVEALDIRPANIDARVRTLSGGNQQKVMLARLLAIAPRFIVLDEPTRGIDVGAKVDILNLVGEMADNGLSVVFISAELEEVLRVCDRVAVLRDARIVDTTGSDQLDIDGLTALVARPDLPEA